MNIVLAIGARPEYMKTWPVYNAFMARAIVPTVVATGQHHDILTQQQAILPMPIEDWLLHYQVSCELNLLHGVIYDKACEYLAGLKPDVVFVQGDTTSALAVAMAAFHLQIPVAHIEAGLRSGSIASPYPEEFNRITIDALSRYLFAPTPRAGHVCRAINPQATIKVTGNTVIDALIHVRGQMPPEPHGLDPFLLLDMHRRELDDKGMDRIVEVVIAQAKAHHLKVYWPAHPSPRVQAVALSFQDQSDGTFRMLPPLEYRPFINLMQQAALILTDSGGVVEEAITLGTPTIQLRDYTDRPEAIDCNASWLASTDPVEVARRLDIGIPYAAAWRQAIQSKDNPYGDGHAGEKIVNAFLSSYQRGE